MSISSIDADELVAAAHEWRPIESAPKDGPYILIWSAEESRAYVGQWYAYDYSPDGYDWVEPPQRWGDHDLGSPISRPTHWMPLPEPPK